MVEGNENPNKTQLLLLKYLDQNLNFLLKNWHFDLYLTFNDPSIIGYFTIIFQIEEKIEPDILVHHLLPSDS